MCIFLCTTAAQANSLEARGSTIVINEAQEIIQIGSQVYYLEDASGELTISEIQKKISGTQFIPVKSQVFTHKSDGVPLWFRFVIQNNTKEPLYLEVGRPFRVWHTYFYSPSPTGYTESYQNAFSNIDSDQGDLPTKAYFVTIPPSDKAETYYLKVESPFSKTMNFQIGNSTSVYRLLVKEIILVTAYLAVIAGMLFYNLFVFFSTRDKIYLLYVSYLVYAILGTTFVSDFPLFGHSYIWEYFYVWYPPAQVLVIEFGILYLNLRQHSKGWYWYLRGLTIFLGVVFPVLALLLPGASSLLGDVLRPTVMLMMLSLAGVGAHMLILKKSNAGYYLAAWGTAFPFVFIYLAAYQNIIPYTLFTKHGIYFAIISEAVLFALALGNRLSTLEKEKEDAQQHNLRLIEEQNMTLERKVKERTREIQLKQEEILTQNEELQQQQEEIQAQKDAILSKSEALNSAYVNITDSINYAERIQRSILIPPGRIISNFEDGFILLKPRDVVSGDFYWHTKIGSKQFLAAVDCTGHGVPGALMSMIGNTLLNETILLLHTFDSGKILKLLDASVRKTLQQEQGANRDGMEMGLCVWDEKKNKLTFSGAKNPMILIRDGKLSLIKGDRRPIGGTNFYTDHDFTEHIINLQKGEEAYLYLLSDGFQDQFGGIGNNKFMIKRLKNLILENHKEDFKTQQKLLEKALKDWMGTKPQIDDILVMGFLLKAK